MSCCNTSTDKTSVEQCAPSPGGCLRCQSVPAEKLPANTSVFLLGPRDGDASATVAQLLKKSGFPCEQYGPLLIVREVRERLQELGSVLKAQLSLYTQSCIQASYTPVGLTTVDQALGAMVFATPLADMIQNIEHQWVHTALNDNWLFTVFHPIIHAATGEVFGNESLIRARNPVSNQVLGAYQVIHACEELNVLHQLDQRARQCAIRAAAQTISGTSKIFINFLPNTIYDPEICLRTTMEAAQANNVSMSRLVFEVVETEKIPDMDHLNKVLSYYRDRGVGTAIDDMGAGFTGIEYITALKPDFVKLDREFVLAAEASKEGRLNMDAIITTSHANHSRVIAEGIETVAQMQMCQNAGVDLLQGFLFAKPACPPQVVTFPKLQREAA